MAQKPESTADAGANAPAADAQEAAPLYRDPLKAKIVLAVFIAYTVALYVLALNEQMGLGLFPSELNQQLSAKIAQFGNPALDSNQRAALGREIVGWAGFAVPPLLQAVEENNPQVRGPAVQCINAIAAKYYKSDISQAGADPVQLRRWWNETKSRLEASTVPDTTEHVSAAQ